MAPSEGLGSGDDAVAAPAERALSFLSKSLTEVQKSTGMDMKLLQSRVQSFRDKSMTLDMSNFPAKAKDVPNRAFHLSVEDFDLLKSLKPKLDRSWSDMSMQERKNELWLAPQMDKALGLGNNRDRGAAVNKQQEQRDRWVVVQKPQGARKKIRVSQSWEEPLKKVKQTVEERLRDLETTAASSKKTPVEFFENVKKTDFFENVKKNLVSLRP